MRKQQRSAIFTIVSANYISFAATLMQSVRKYHPTVARYIILSDVMHQFPEIDLAAEIVGCDDLGYSRIKNMKLWYSVIEFNTAIKPFVFDWLFKTKNFKDVLYIDPDILLYSPLREVYNGLVEHNIVLTPHIMAPLQDGKEPSDITIMKSGIYNLGFLGARADEHTKILIGWWCDRLYLHCRVNIQEHMFTDQRWMDLAPVFVPKPLILRHPGYNVAYWNLAQRDVKLQRREWTVDGEPLRFFHFSGIKPTDPESFSKHQNRFRPENLGQVAVLCSEYRNLVLENGWLKTSDIPYGFRAFADGPSIDDFGRRCILRSVDLGQLDSTQTLDITSEFLESPEPDGAFKAGSLTRFAYQVWLDRDDLKKTFELTSEQGFQSYMDWFCGGGAERDGINSHQITVVQRLRDRKDVSQIEIAQPSLRAPPWISITRQCWSGTATLVNSWLSEIIHFEIQGLGCDLPRFAALLWERRPDLQNTFDMQTPESLELFLAWLLSDGIIEGTVKSSLFCSEFAVRLEASSEISSFYQDVPVTHAMIAMRRETRARLGLGAFTRFPFDKQARMEHGLWFAFVAPKLFNWPEALGSTARRYFQTRTHIGFSRFKFTIGMIAIWELRPDLQRVYPLTTLDSKRALLRWFLFYLGRDYNLVLEDMHSGLISYLSSSSWYGKEISVLLALVYEERRDLRDTFNLGDEVDREKFLLWAHDHLSDYLIERSLGPLARGLGVIREELKLELAESTMKISIALAGHWEKPSGIGEDLRASVASLQACGFQDFLIVDFDTCQIRGADGTPLPHAKSLEAEKCVVHRNADTALEDWGILTKLGIQADKWIGHWAWELERLPSYWRHSFSFYDEIWAATEFSRGAFEQEQLRPVRLVPNAVIPPLFHKKASLESPLSPSQATIRFLFVFDFSSYVARKNPWAVVNAFTSAFPDGSEHVQLVLKTQNASAVPKAAFQLLESIKDPRIFVRDQILSRTELTDLVSSSDAFISLHRSEGFGRGPAEAMLLGLPVVVTNYSGTVDYADETCSYPVKFRLVPVNEHEYIGVEGQFWAEAQIDDAARALRWIYEQPLQAQTKGRLGQERVAKLYSPVTVGSLMLEALSPLKDIESTCAFTEEGC